MQHLVMCTDVPNQPACLWGWWHLVSPPNKGDVDTVLVILSFVLESELSIWGDDSNLAHVSQHLGSVVLPVSKNGHAQLCSVPFHWVALFSVNMNMWLISA